LGKSDITIGLNNFNHQRKDWHRSIKTKMNEDLLHHVKQWIRDDSTDVIFTYLSGELISPETMRKLSSFGVPMINLALNDKEAFIGKIKTVRQQGCEISVDISTFAGPALKMH